MTNPLNFLIIAGFFLAVIGLIRMPSALRQQQRRTFLLRMQGPGTGIMKIGVISMIISAVALFFQQ